MKLTIKNRIKLIYEILTIKSGHSHTVSEKQLSTFIKGYEAGLKDGYLSNDIDRDLIDESLQIHQSGVESMMIKNKTLEKQIEAMKKCYVKLTDSPIFLDNGGVVYAADRKLMSEFDDAFEDEIKTG